MLDIVIMLCLQLVFLYTCLMVNELNLVILGIRSEPNRLILRELLLAIQLLILGYPKPGVTISLLLSVISRRLMIVKWAIINTVGLALLEIEPVEAILSKTMSMMTAMIIYIVTLVHLYPNVFGRLFDD